MSESGGPSTSCIWDLLSRRLAKGLPPSHRQEASPARPQKKGHRLHGGPVNSNLELERVSIDDQVIVRCLEAGDMNGCSRQSEDGDVAMTIVDHLDMVVIVEEDRVGRAVAYPVQAEVDVELGDSAS